MLVQILEHCSSKHVQMHWGDGNCIKSSFHGLDKGIIIRTSKKNLVRLPKGLDLGNTAASSLKMCAACSETTAWQNSRLNIVFEREKSYSGKNKKFVPAKYCTRALSGTGHSVFCLTWSLSPVSGMKISLTEERAGFQSSKATQGTSPTEHQVSLQQRGVQPVQQELSETPGEGRQELDIFTEPVRMISSCANTSRKHHAPRVTRQTFRATEVW